MVSSKIHQVKTFLSQEKHQSTAWKTRICNEQIKLVAALWKQPYTEGLICGRLDGLAEMAGEQNDRNTSWLTEILAGSFQSRKQLTSKNTFKVCHLCSNWGYAYRTRWNVFHVFKKSLHRASFPLLTLSRCHSQARSGISLIGSAGFILVFELADSCGGRVTLRPLRVLSFVEWLMAWMRSVANHRVSGSIYSETDKGKGRGRPNHCSIKESYKIP